MKTTGTIPDLVRPMVASDDAGSFQPGVNNMNNMTTRTVRTKLNRDADKVETALSINWENCSAEDIRAMAEAALVVKLQNQWRTAEAIPTGEHSVDAAEYKVGVRAPKKSLMEQIAALPEDQRKAILAALKA